MFHRGGAAEPTEPFLLSCSQLAHAFNPSALASLRIPALDLYVLSEGRKKTHLHTLHSVDLLQVGLTFCSCRTR